jgi:predicted metal-binding membrane protein
MFERLTSNLGFKLSVGVPLLAVAAGAWYLSAYTLQSAFMGTGASMSPLPIVMMASMFNSPDIFMVSTFLLVWVVGMVAMMFPAMIPVMSLHSRMMDKDEEHHGPSRYFQSTLVLGGYLSLYAILGLGLFIAVFGVFQLGLVLPWLSSFSIAGVVAVLFVTGIWQLTPLKEKMLAKCISPLGFFLTHSRKGTLGAVRMGAEHGGYCVGCCWLYMLVMLAVAAMSLVSMALLSALIIIEKAFVGKSSWFKWVSAGIFFSLALIVAAFPSYLSLF